MLSGSKDGVFRSAGYGAPCARRGTLRPYSGRAQSEAQTSTGHRGSFLHLTMDSLAFMRVFERGAYPFGMNILLPAPTPSSRQLTMVGHIDATPPELEPLETAEIDQLEKGWRPDAQVCLSISRRTTSCLRRAVTGGLQLGASGLCAAASTALGPPGAVLGLVGLGFQVWGLRSLVRAGLDILVKSEPAWSGTRTYEVGPDVRSHRIDSPLVSIRPALKPEPSELTHFMADALQRFPAQVTACMVSGHGTAYQSLAGFDVAQWKQMLEDVAVQSGRKFDVLVCESCLTGNLEALRQLKDTARYAVVSAQTMEAEGLPWTSIMKGLPSVGLTAEGFARSIVAQADAAGAVQTLAVVDLARIEPLAEAVENLGGALRQAVAAGEAAQVADALGGARVLGLKNPIVQSLFSMRDLGEIAARVEKHVNDPASRNAARAVTQACRQAVVTGVTDADHAGSSFISVQGPQRFFLADDYRKKTGFEAWSGLLTDLSARR